MNIFKRAPLHPDFCTFSGQCDSCGKTYEIAGATLVSHALRGQGKPTWALGLLGMKFDNRNSVVSAEIVCHGLHQCYDGPCRDVVELLPKHIKGLPRNYHETDFFKSVGVSILLTLLLVVVVSFALAGCGYPREIELPATENHEQPVISRHYALRVHDMPDGMRCVEAVNEGGLFCYKPEQKK